MQKKVYVFLFILEVAIVYLASNFQKSSGYMDADYYYANAVNIASGKGFKENFVWNYLDNPKGIPHPSFTYWMPLASLVSSLGLVLTGDLSFPISKIPFFLLSGLIPILAAHITLLISGDRKSALMAALFSIFSGFYLIYLGLPETFLVYMLLGACFFEVGMTLFEKSGKFKLKYLMFCTFLGGIAGLIVLTRADGLLWVVAGLVLVLFASKEWGKEKHFLHGLWGILCLSAGFCLITAAWYIRNLSIFGSWMAPGGINTLWLTDYNQTFIYPASLLTFKLWWGAGVLANLKEYLSAIWLNLQTLVIVQGEIFLVPFVIIAFLKYRNIRILNYYALILLFQFIVSTFIFPYSGSRGGFFHSGSAFQITLWALAGIGFWSLLEWGVAKRGWQIIRSAKMFVPAMILLVLLFSGFIYWQKVIGIDPTNPVWNQEHLQYQAIESKLLANGFSVNQEILIGNPPGYYVSTARPAFAIPDGDLNTLREVAQRYGVEILAIDQNHPRGLNSFYSQSASQGGFTYLFNVGKYEIYSFRGN
jgi:hypothetical protein